MITETLKIIVVEDNVNDFTLIERQINKVLENSYILHVNSFEKFKASLVDFRPDIIISDYKLGGFTGMDVLDYVHENSPSTCFIFVTGTINNEEIAVNTILNGASGYILKKNISRLNEKLSPIFEKVIENRKAVLSQSHQEIIRGFIDSANKSNEMHIESYENMRKSLEKFKKENK